MNYIVEEDANTVGIQKATNEYQTWIEQAELLVKGKANHAVKKPVDHTESEFGVWFYSDDNQSNTLSGFKEIGLLHQDFHAEYKSLFDGAEQVCDEKSLRAIKRHASKLKNLSSLILNQLEAPQEVAEEGDEVAEHKYKETAQMIDIDEKEVESFVADEEVQQDDSSSADMHRLLKEQDLSQLNQEQELTELEIKQLEDRKALTLKGVQQVEQYQALKEQEVEKQLSDHDKLEENNINEIYLSQQNLTKVKEQISEKTDELKQLALVDEKLGQRKAEEKEKEKKILEDFNKYQMLDKQDISQLENQKKQREDEAESLKSQLKLIESELVDLDKKLKTKQEIIDSSNQKKELKLQELAQNSRLQDRLNGHKIRVKEEKQEELNQLVKEKTTLRENIDSLEVDSVTLENKRIEIKNQNKKELRQLEEQQRFKSMAIEKLDQDKDRKQQELKELAHQQSIIEESLTQMDSSDFVAEKVPEEV